jgi:AcrR family transcriptional regulator
MASIRLLGGPASRERVVAEVARPAGVGRVTLYGHFPSREELMDAVLAHAIHEANTVLDAEAIHHGPSLRCVVAADPLLLEDRGSPPQPAGRHASRPAGRVAAALMAQASELLAQPPAIEPVDVIAAKLPG